MGASVIVSLLLSLCVACTGSSPSHPTHSVKVTPGSTATLNMGGGVSVTLPAGAVNRPGTLSGQAISASHVPSGMTLMGSAYHFELTGASLIKDATVTLPTPIPEVDHRPGPRAAIIAYYDSSAAQWMPVGGRFISPAGSAMSIATPHLSDWGAFTAAAKALSDFASSTFKALLGTNDTAAQPKCAGQANSGVTVKSSSGSTIKWCIGSDNRGPILKVTNDRGYAVQVLYPAAWQESGSTGGDFVEVIANWLAKYDTFAPRGQSAAIIPGGETVTFKLNGGGSLTTMPSPAAYLASALAFGIDTLVSTTGTVPFAPTPKPSAKVTAIRAVFASKSCVTSMQRMGHDDVTKPSAAFDIFWQAMHLASGCLGDAWEHTYGGIGFVVSFIVSVFTWLMDGLKLVLQGIGAALDTALHPAGYTISITQQVSPVTLADLQSAPVPSLRGEPAGNLVNGNLPNAGNGTVSLDTVGGHAPAIGDFTGDGIADAAAVIDATSGAGGGDQYVELYTNGSHLTRLGQFDPDSVEQDVGHAQVLAMVVRGGDVLIDWTTFNMGSSSRGFWSARLHWDGHNIDVQDQASHTGITGMQLWSDPSLTITPTSLGRVRLGMSMAQAEAAAGFIFDQAGDGFIYPSVTLSGGAHLYVRAGPTVSVQCVGAQGGAGIQTISTPEGVKIGDPVSRLKAVYGSRAVYVPAPNGGMAPRAGYVVHESGGVLAISIDESTQTITAIAGSAQPITPSACTG